jgi:hypothetical protein
MNGLECFADAIMHFEGWSVGNASYRNRNPGNLRSASTATGQDSRGFAVFPSLVDGYKALLADLAAKFTGHTRTGLGPSSTILEFFRVYAPAADSNYPEKYADFVAHWLTVALQRPIPSSTKLEEIWSPNLQTNDHPAVATDPDLGS